MPPTRVLLVELQAELADRVMQGLSALGVQATITNAEDLVARLVADAPDLAIVNLDLSRGSGFGLVNRVRRMEALASLKIVLVAEKATDAAVDTHRKGPTPAAAYVRRGEGVSAALFGEQVLEAAKHVLGQIPEVAEVDWRDLVELDAGEAASGEEISLEKVIAELGPFRVLRRLRDEDGGAVFACRDDELRRNVAIKLMPPEKNEGDDGRERLQRFQREGRVLALLQSPYVLGVYGAGTQRGIPYLVRELIDGETLAEQIARSGPLDLGTALARARETALGLKHAAAAGVIHRDVRPENIRVVDGHAKLARFAMGKRVDDPRITRGGLQLIDMTYVAPERVRGQEDARGDIYALGVTLYHLLTGKSPYRVATCVDIVTGKLVEPATPLIDARPGTPFSVHSLVMRLLSEDPTMRPPDWSEVVLLLDDAIRTTAGGLLSSVSLVSPSPLSAPGAGQAKAAEPTADWNEAVEPSAVHGTLRLMSVAEIVQSLELAKKTAVVTLPNPDGGEGKLAFDVGRLTHASARGKRGEDAFFTLIARKSGPFRVDYDSAAALEQNIDKPVAGLLLEAARRTDDVARASIAPTAAQSSWTLQAMPPPSSSSSAPPPPSPQAAPVPEWSAASLPAPSSSAPAAPSSSPDWSAALPEQAPPSQWSLPVLEGETAPLPVASSPSSEGEGEAAFLASTPDVRAAVEAAAAVAASSSSPTPTASPTPPPKKKSKPEVAPVIDDDSVEALLPGSWRRDGIGTPLGIVAIIALGGLAAWAGFLLPPMVVEDPDDGSARAIAELLGKQHTQLVEARERIAELAPKVEAYDSAASASASASEAAKKRVADAKASLETSLKDDVDEHRVALREDHGEVVVEIPEGSIFAGDGDDVSNDGKALAGRIAAALAEAKWLDGGGSVRVEGHTDDTEPRGKHKNNWGLSGARATAVQKLLQQGGLAAAGLPVSALADTMPLASNKGPKGRARNRRVELHLVAGTDADAAAAPR